MTLYYEDDLVQLHVADSISEYHGWLDADVLVTDPPYGMQYQSNWPKEGALPIIGDATTAVRDMALELWGTVKPALVFGTWRAPRPPAHRIRELLIWYKGNYPGMGDLSLPWGSNHEEVYVMGGTRPEDWTGKRSASVIVSSRGQGTAPKRHDHPTPKPVYLMQQLISKINPNYTIADPFAGAGATLVAAKMLGRSAVGVELDEHFAEEAAKRLRRIH